MNVTVDTGYIINDAEVDCYDGVVKDPDTGDWEACVRNTDCIRATGQTL